MTLRIASIICLSVGLFPKNSAAQWEVLSDSVFNSWAYWMAAVKIADDGSIWASTGPQPNIESDQPRLAQVHISPDAGLNWKLSEFEGPWARDVAPIDSLRAFICRGQAIGLYKTVDAGNSWSKVESFQYPCRFVHFFNSQEGWVFNGSARDNQGADKRATRHSLTRDGGKTWTHIGGPGWETPRGTSLPEPDTLEVLGDGPWTNGLYDARDSVIVVAVTEGYWISNDRGFHWRRQKTPLTDAGISTACVAMKDQNTVMVVGNFFHEQTAGQLGKRAVTPLSYATHNSGKSWIRGEPKTYPSSLEYIPGTESEFILSGYITLFNSSHGTEITHDLGQTWEIIDTHRVGPVYFLNHNTGVAIWSKIHFWNGSGPVYRWNHPTGHPLQAYKYYWLIGSILLLLVSGVFLIRRTYRRKKQRIDKQIKTLRESAMKAQMNADFIMHCLQAIKELINSKRKDLANDYISSFASLTRGVLNASAVAAISLEDDILLLRNYLNLEQLRFTNRLHYEIKVDDEIDPYHCIVPVMAVQYLVENRIHSDFIKHDTEGFLKVQYYLENDSLNIDIQDNFGCSNDSIQAVGVAFTNKERDFQGEYSEVRIKKVDVSKDTPAITRISLALKIS